MKRIVLTAAIILVTASIALAIFGTGFGKTVTVTGTDQSVAGFTANTLTVLNGGTAIVYGLVNIDTTTMDARVAAGSAIAIPGGMSFTWNAQAHDSIANVCLVTAGATNICYIGAY